MVFLSKINNDAGVCDFDDLDISVQELIHAAVEARKYSYCPYNKLNGYMGAAVRTKDGTIYTGCTVENGYTNGVCAEKVAVSKAISGGKCDFVAVAIVTNSKSDFFTPCGVCCQFLAEFAKRKNLPIYTANPGSNPQRVLCTSIMELLPQVFGL